MKHYQIIDNHSFNQFFDNSIRCYHFFIVSIVTKNGQEMLSELEIYLNR